MIEGFRYRGGARPPFLNRGRIKINWGEAGIAGRGEVKSDPVRAET